MKRFYFTTSVDKASGWQRWFVEADNFEDAKIACLKGDYEFDYEEIEVTSGGDPEWEDENGEETLG